MRRRKRRRRRRRRKKKKKETILNFFVCLFVCLGRIIPKKLRLRRSSKLMFYDPVTLTILPDSTNQASGSLYLDDETTLAHEQAKLFIYRRFNYNNGHITCRRQYQEISPEISNIQEFKPLNTVERIEIGNVDRLPREVVLLIGSAAAGDAAGKRLSFNWDASRNVLTIKKADVKVADDWDIQINW